MQRQAELDWLRGLMLVLMTMTHLPTWFSAHAGQPFGFVSSAEGFVFLSAFLVGAVYSTKAQSNRFLEMRRALWRRALKVYGAHIALLLVLLLVLVPIAVAREAHAITDLASFYLHRPHLALASGLVLAYNPPLLDILPMYVVFLAASPFAIEHALRRGWGTLLSLSAVLWLFAQYGGGRQFYESIAALVGWPVPYSATGSFSFAAWQLLWLIGLRVGAGSVAPGAARKGCAPVGDDRWERAGFAVACAIAAVFFVWRHTAGQVPFGNDAALNSLFDKWHLGPLRLLNFAVLALIAVHGRRVLAEWAEDSPVATLGRASLVVFSAHLLACLALLTALGGVKHAHLGIADIALVGGTLLTLYGVARASLNGEDAVRQWMASFAGGGSYPASRASASGASTAGQRAVPVSARAGR